MISLISFHKTTSVILVLIFSRETNHPTNPLPATTSFANIRQRISGIGFVYHSYFLY